MKLKRLVLMLVLFLSLSPVFSGGHGGLFAGTKNTSDDYITDSVRQKLAEDQVVKGGAIEVDVKAGVVTLKGKVQEARQKAKAEKIAKRVRGVTSVVNGITIERP